ncbi:28S ribosomal protein S17, mitochondrial [Belonocnema kinseyi]|uniref:28S ribosomal protein S17, mitochondrial n=1 Tax=Belonocnema kinseyi TaxID=2817044 RepID=UPI00143DC5BE|nr:28S ribosomal protein S17, mitochondrial [Belonocnema kinseyi]
MASSAASAAVKTSSVVSKYFLGKCMPSLKENSAKIRIPRLVLDEYLHMYFREFEFVYAHDPKKLCKTGDTVLVKALPQKLTRLITHEVIEIVYPLGDIVDPITGKKVVAGKYREDLETARRLYGATESGFDYEKAPPRGSMEGKRDFTHRPHEVKFYEGQLDTV